MRDNVVNIRCPCPDAIGCADPAPRLSQELILTSLPPAIPGIGVQVVPGSGFLPQSLWLVGWAVALRGEHPAPRPGTFTQGFQHGQHPFRAKAKAPEPMPRWAKAQAQRLRRRAACPEKQKTRTMTALSSARAQGAGSGKIFTMDSIPQRLHLTGRSLTCVVGRRKSTVCFPHTGQRYRLLFVTILAHSFWFFNCLASPFLKVPDYYTLPQDRKLDIQLEVSGRMAIM